MMFYVYVDYRADNNQPFYVGKGRWARVRCMTRNNLWQHIASKHGVRRKIVLETSSNDDALSTEIRLIHELGTRNHINGANMTDGGEGSLGWVPSNETRKKMRLKKVGRTLSKNHRKNLSIAHRIRYSSENERQKTGEKSRLVWNNVDYRKMMSKKKAGERNSRAILKEHDVKQIRDAWKCVDVSIRGSTARFCREYAIKHSVTTESIFGIVKNKSWKHIT